MVLDIIRIGFLCTVAGLYIAEAVTEAVRNSFTVAVFTRIMLFTLCMVCFAMEGFFIMKQTPTAEILAREEEVIDYSELVYYYQMLFYMQAVNLILLISFLIPFFQFLTDIQSTLNVITNVASLILLFGCLWWAFAVMFAYVISNTWGYQLKGFRNLQSAVLQMLATMVLASNEDRLNFENKETGEQFKFLFILSMTIYVLKLLIVCQVTAIIIEQYRKVMLNWKTIEDKHQATLGFTMKGVCLDWVYLSFCCRVSKQG